MKGFTGFPTLAFMDAEGEVLAAKVTRTVEGFRQTAEALASVTDLAKAEKEGKLEGDAAVKLLAARIDLGQLDFAKAKERYGAITGPIAPKARAELEARLTDLEFAAIVAKHNKDVTPARNELMQKLRATPAGEQPTPEMRREVSTKLQELTTTMGDAIAAELQTMLLDERVPSDKSALQFWQYLLRAAERRKDEAATARARKELEALAERVPAQKAIIERALDPQAARGQVRSAVPLVPIAVPPAGGKDAKKGSGK